MNLAAASNSASNPAALRSSVSQDTVVGLFRDLRGITMATNSRRTYGACQTPPRHAAFNRIWLALVCV